MERASLNLLDWSIVAFYILAMVGLSAWLGRKQQSVEDYYLGGNNLPWWAIGLSTMATQCSSNSFLGTPAFVALAAGGGLVFLQTELALPLAMIVIMLFMLPFYRRAGVISVYEYLELRFGVVTRTAMSVLFQVTRALATGVTVYSVGQVLEIAVGIPIFWSIILVGVVTIIYDTFGGMEAVVWSDVIQMGVLYGSALLLAGWAVSLAGGPSAVLEFWSRSSVTVAPGKAFTGLAERFQVLQLEQFGLHAGEDYSFWACLLGFLFLYMSYYGCDQSQVQRELSSRNVDDTNLSLFFNGCLRFFLALTMVVVGLAIGAALFTDLATNREFLLSVLDEPARQNQMVMHFVLTYMPHGFIGLIVVAIFAAAMSSLDSAINSLSATTMRDVYERFVDDSPDERAHLLFSRLFTVSWGTFCTAAAFLTPYLGDNVVVAINKVGSATYGPILGVFLLGLLTKRATDQGVLAGLAFGVLFDLWLWVGTDVSWLWWNVAGCLVTLVVGYGASLLDHAPALEGLRDLVWTSGSYESFGYKRDWRLYSVVLVGFFFLFLATCILIQSVPSFFAP